MVRPTGAVTTRHKPCKKCGESMPYKNIRKTYCDRCRVEVMYQKKREDQTARKQPTSWDGLIGKFRARRTPEEWARVVRIAGEVA